MPINPNINIEPKRVYVAPDGPISTLDAARIAARQYLPGKQKIEVIFSTGVYQAATTFEEEDSGTEYYPWGLRYTIIPKESESSKWNQFHRRPTTMTHVKTT